MPHTSYTDAQICDQLDLLPPFRLQQVSQDALDDILVQQWHVQQRAGGGQPHTYILKSQRLSTPGLKAPLSPWGCGTDCEGIGTGRVGSRKLIQLAESFYLQGQKVGLNTSVRSSDSNFISWMIRNKQYQEINARAVMYVGIGVGIPTLGSYLLMQGSDTFG